jgi:hypothetical protein
MVVALNPVGEMGINKFINFDFPVGIFADSCKGNVDPGPNLPEIENMYGQLGNPKCPQGWPCIMEWTPEVEDPGFEPWIDMLIDEDREAVIYHTGRLSGDMVVELADKTHTSVVTAHAVPYKAGNAIRLDTSGDVPLEPDLTKKANVWFWRSDKELVYTLKVGPFKPKDKGLVTGEVYKLLIEWEFYHTVPGTNPPKRHLEPFAGFDDNITFKVLAQTIE